MRVALSSPAKINHNTNNFTSEPIMSGPVELQTGIGEWKKAFLELFDTGLRITMDDDERQDVFFTSETKISIPMRNLKAASQYKGCAFQVETVSDIRAFLAPSLADKNTWARKLNIALGELRTSGRDNVAQAASDENCMTPTHMVTKLAATESAERHRQQKAAVQRLAQSLQPTKTASRLGSVDVNASLSAVTPAAPLHAVVPPQISMMVDRSSEIEALTRSLETKEAELRQRERELADTVQQLQKEQSYREQISTGLEKWKQDLTRQRDQKLQDTRERLDDEVQKREKLEAEKADAAVKLQDAEAKIAELQAQVHNLQNQIDDSQGLQREIGELRARLDKELAFVQVLEHDTQQLADELVSLGRQHFELKAKYEGDVDAYRSQCADLKQQLDAKEEENMQLKVEMGRLQQENRRLQEAQHRMHREFFFSLALSIKLSLAQQGIYSNADLNNLYEKILAVDYGQWHKFIETQLRQSEMEDGADALPSSSVTQQTPMRKQHAPAPPPPASSNKKKGGLFGLFN